MSKVQLGQDNTLHFVITPQSSFICDVNSLSFSLSLSTNCKKYVIKISRERKIPIIHVNCLAIVKEIIPKHFIYLLLYSKCSKGQLTPSGDMNLQALNIPCCRGVSVYLCVVPLCSRKDLRLFTHMYKIKQKKYVYSGELLYFLVSPLVL